ncbi:MAG: ATP-grasp domain-containing protein, partial [Candidatus Sungbacteria bacterium]|nr:ATP-grasp domain-containing protein [Candidatus Sungbacteria bacterium]
MPALRHRSRFGFKEFCDKNGIITAEWIKLNKKNKEQLKELGLPLVIKPTNSGSSVDTFIVKDENALKQVNLDLLFKKYGAVLVERFIDGVEITVGVLGKEVLPVVEIQPPEGEWFNYENKYSGKTKELAPAPSLTEEQKKEAQEITRKIHFGLG